MRLMLIVLALASGCLWLAGLLRGHTGELLWIITLRRGSVRRCQAFVAALGSQSRSSPPAAPGRAATS